MNADYLRRISASLILALALLTLDGCAKVIAPTTNQSQAASYDPEDTKEPTSGIWAVAPDGGRIVTNHYRERRNALGDIYGDQFDPDLKTDEGLTPTTWKGKPAWHTTKSAHIKFGQMIQWKRDGREPTGGVKRWLDKIL